jgi:hypothetical protein
MLTTGSRRERLLVDAFVTAERRTRGAVVALNEQTIIASAATSALLEEGLDHATLWEAAREAILRRSTRREGEETLCGEGDRAFRVTPPGDRQHRPRDRADAGHSTTALSAHAR